MYLWTSALNGNFLERVPFFLWPQCDTTTPFPVGRKLVSYCVETGSFLTGKVQFRVICQVELNLLPIRRLPSFAFHSTCPSVHAVLSDLVLTNFAISIAAVHLSKTLARIFFVFFLIGEVIGHLGVREYR